MELSASGPERKPLQHARLCSEKHLRIHILYAIMYGLV